MDSEAICVSSKKDLRELGLEAKGDILALQDFAKKHDPSAATEYEDRKRKLIEKLQNGRNTKSKKSKVSETTIDEKVKTRKITIGWMHCSDTRYVTVRASNGGGTRRVDMPVNSSKDDIIDEAKRLFFPDGASSLGDAEEMLFNLANFQGENIPSSLDNDTSTKFTLKSYIEKHKLTHVRLYLASKRTLKTFQSDHEEDEDESLMKPVIPIKQPPRKDTSKKRDLGKEWRIGLRAMASADSTLTATSIDTGMILDSDDEDTTQPYSTALIGSTTERKALLKEQDDAFQKSLETDAKKAKDQNEKDDKRRKLEDKRLERLSKVPPEPTPGMGVLVAVKHVSTGKVKRFFSEDDLMKDVYNWVGSLSSEPEFFQLCLLPGIALSQAQSVCSLRGTLLHMEVMENEAFNDIPSHLDSATTDLQQLLDTIPDVLMEGDEDESTTADSYASLMEKRKIAFNNLSGGDAFITLRRDNIVDELLKKYKSPDITNKHVYVSFDGETAVGSGVTREMFALFWDTLLSDYSQGDSEFTIPSSLSLGVDDYVAIGRIITHQFIECGTFPVRINQAAIHPMLFGEVKDGCKVSSFLRLFGPKEREVLSNALSLQESFPIEDILDLLEDYGVREQPSPTNIRRILERVATNELICKPYMSLTNIKKGLEMGSFWNNVTRDEVISLYDVIKPTQERVLQSLTCSPSTPKEDQIFRWLKRYIKASTYQMLSQFLRFCTAGDVIDPHMKIAVNMALLPPSAMRPTSKTCFRILILPRNYENYTEMKKNLDLYLRDSTSWDLQD